MWRQLSVFLLSKWKHLRWLMLQLNPELTSLVIVGISSWLDLCKMIFRDAANGHTAGHVTAQLSQRPLTVSDHGCQRGCRTHWFNASLQYKAWGHGGQQNCLRGSSVVTALLNLHLVVRASRSQASARTHTRARSINAQTQQPATTQVIPQAFAWLTLHSQALQFSLSISNVCQGTRVKQEWHISILFPSAVCTVCRLELDWASAAPGSGTPGTMGRGGEQWCQTPRERNTQSDTGTAGTIWRCWSKRPAWRPHAGCNIANRHRCRHCLYDQ